MKKTMKKFICFGLMLFTAFLFMPNVNASVVDDAFAALSEDGRTINVTSVDPDKFVERGIFAKYDEEAIENYKYMLYNWVVRAYINKVIGDYPVYISEVCNNKNTCDIDIGLTEENLVTKSFDIVYTGVYDLDKMKDAEKYLENITYDNRIMDLMYINNVVNYSNVKKGLFWNNSHAFKIFPNLKEESEKNTEVNYILGFHGAGGIIFGDGNNGAVFVEKDGCFYAAKELLFLTEQMFIIPDTVENTHEASAEALKNKIDNYLNRDDITVSVEYYTGENYNQEWYLGVEDSHGNPVDEIENRMKPYFGNGTGVESRGVYTLSITSEDDSINIEKQIALLSAPKEKYDSLNISIKSVDRINNIYISSNSNAVPLDTNLKTEKVTEEEYVKKGLEDSNYNLLVAYDINLYSSIKDAYIKNIPDGVEVLLPLNDDYSEKTIKILYIKEDSTIGEDYTATVIELNGKKYAKFITTHFSTYAIAETVNDNVISNPETASDNTISNPETGDGIMNFIIIGSISLMSLVGVVLYTKKKRFKWMIVK